MPTLVVLESRYHKVSNWTDRFFFVGGRGWEFLVGQISRVEFPIKTAWGVMLNDKAVHSVVTSNELSRIVIMRD